jgi:hypothetical protein
MMQKRITHIMIVARTISTKPTHHNNYELKGDLIHWQLQFISTSDTVAAHYNLQTPMSENIGNLSCFTADVVSRQLANRHQTYYASDIEILCKSRTWLNHTVLAYCFQVPNDIHKTINDYKNFFVQNNLQMYYYDQNGFGCRTWVTKAARTLQERHEILPDSDVVGKITSEVTRLRGITTNVTVEDDEGEYTETTNVYEVPEEGGRFYTYERKTKKATTIPP